MVICFFVGCMCAPCFKRRRAPQKTPQFREPIGNSMILCRAIRELFPSWSLANDQALRSWILSMPASIRGRLDLLPEEDKEACAAYCTSGCRGRRAAPHAPRCGFCRTACCGFRRNVSCDSNYRAPGGASCTPPAPVHSGFAVRGASVAPYGARGTGTFVPVVAWSGSAGWPGLGAAAPALWARPSFRSCPHGAGRGRPPVGGGGYLY